MQAMIAALEKEMEAQQMGISLTPEERLEIFGHSHDDLYREAEARWGETDAWMESQRKAAAYTKQDWQQIKAEGVDIGQTQSDHEAKQMGRP